MFSIKGTFSNNKIKLSEPLKIEKRTNVIIVFLDEDSHTGNGAPIGDYPEAEVLLDDKDYELEDSENDLLGEKEFSEEDYTKIRKHRRYDAKGSICLNGGDGESEFPLLDYSAGGLSFVANQPFKVGQSLTASVKDPIESNSSVLDFEFEIARIENNGKSFKIGCKFFDPVDEEIWHSLMS